MKRHIAFAILGAAAMIAVAPLLIHPAQSQQRMITPSPSPAPSTPAAPKITAPSGQQLNTMQDRDKMKMNPQGNPASFNVKKDEAKKTDERNKQKILDARDEVSDKAAAKKKKDIEANADAALKTGAKKKEAAEKKKMAEAAKKETNPCKKACFGDPCGCTASVGPTSISLPGGGKSSDPSKMLVLNSCKKTCSTSVSSCQATC